MKKNHQHTYRERAQPKNRQRFGLLEKKRDWQARAKDHKKKQAELTKLKTKAISKNQDEFYLGMSNRRLQNGVFKEQLKKSSENVELRNQDEEDTYLDNLLSKYSKSAVNKVTNNDEVNFEDENLKRGNDLNFVTLRLQKERKKIDQYEVDPSADDRWTAREQAHNICV